MHFLFFFILFLFFSRVYGRVGQDIPLSALGFFLELGILQLGHE